MVFMGDVPHNPIRATSISKSNMTLVFELSGTRDKAHGARKDP